MFIYLFVCYTKLLLFDQTSFSFSLFLNSSLKTRLTHSSYKLTLEKLKTFLVEKFQNPCALLEKKLSHTVP